MIRAEDRLIVDEVRETYGALPVRAGDVVLDLGAHVGAASMLFADRGARVVAVEPDPTNVECLRANLAGRSVEIIAAAVGAEAGKTTLHAYPGRGYLSTTIGADREREPITVPVVALRDLLAEHGPTIVKCDIEFGEYDLPELWDLPSYVHVLALELHIRYDLIFLHRRESSTELRQRRMRAAGLLARLKRQGFTAQRLTTKRASDRRIDDRSGLDPYARSIDGVWVR